MNLKYKKVASNIQIFLYGELDEYSASKLRKELDAIIENNLLAKKFIFDLSGVTFMDSTGIGMFLGRYKKIRSLNACVFVTGISSNIEKIFEISGLFKLIPKI